MVIHIVHGIGIFPGSNFGQDKLHIIEKADMCGVRKSMLARQIMSIKVFLTLLCDSALKTRVIFWVLYSVNLSIKKKAGPCVLN